MSRAQLGDAGYDSDAVRRRVATGEWQQVGNAFVLHSGVPTSDQLQWAAVLTAPGLVAITARTAAKQYGLRGFELTAVDVLVTHSDGMPPRIDGVHWHVSRRFSERDIALGFGLPMVSRGRAVVDAAAWTPRPRIACALLAAAVQQGVVPTAALRRELAAAGAVRHSRILGSIMADIEGGADSLSEIDFVKLARKAGLPPPIRQSIRVDSAGRRRYLDADFGTFAVEVDGGLHLLAQNYWYDARRQNDLVLGGDHILRFPSIAIRLEEDVVLAQLRRAHQVFG
ncbi:MAG TPA: hypothetical protein VGD55_03680 [Acidothermaceae bacterium]